ncbi:hypothetical protein ID866_3796 [Astraeus odoratus]|nr:hypothetical protein ID866_3796 [Astraeus odoratus]
MRLTLSTKDYLNTYMADEYGQVCYTVSTIGFFNAKTTIYKVIGGSNDPEVLATIQWRSFGSDTVWFLGREIPGKELLTSRKKSSCVPAIFCGERDGLTFRGSSRFYTGPDGNTYKWKIQSTNCWLKLDGSPDQLAKYHQRNLGIRTPKHPPYLEVSESLFHMLDHVVVTFVCAEKASQRQLTNEVSSNAIVSTVIGVVAAC